MVCQFIGSVLVRVDTVLLTIMNMEDQFQRYEFQGKFLLCYLPSLSNLIVWKVLSNDK